LRIQAGGRKQHATLELEALSARKRDVDAVIRRAFGDQRLWREERVDGELDPAAIAQQVLFQQHVIDVMTRVAFVARQVDRPVDVDRQIGVDLDQTAVVALIPVVAAPALTCDVFDGEAFTRWKRDALQRAAATAVNRGFEYGIEPLTRDHENAAEGRGA